MLQNNAAALDVVIYQCLIGPGMRDQSLLIKPLARWLAIGPASDNKDMQQ